MSEEEKVERIKGCLTEETKKDFAEIKIETQEDLEKLAKKTGSPIFECSEDKELFALDPKSRLKFSKKEE